jgi:hypothetical protein
LEDLVERVRPAFSCDGAISRRLWAVFRTSEIGKAGIEITGLPPHRAGQTREKRNFVSLSTERLQLR